MAFGQTLLLRSSRLIVVPSAFFKELLLQGLPDIDSERIVVSPSSGIDFHALRVATAGRPCYWDRPAAQRVAEIGYIGRIDADKGWEALFDAFITLPEAVRAGARLHFWGEGKDSERLRARIASEGEGRIVRHGAIPVSELPVAHARFDFQVVPSVRESLGLAALEGLGAGHVLICNAIRPFTDMTVDGVSALHVDHRSGRDLATVLAEALQLPDEALRTLAKNGQEIARAFDRPAVAAGLAHQIDTHLVY
jgi:glycosyltransferase involved in cell wall biosynthesis